MHTPAPTLDSLSTLPLLSKEEIIKGFPHAFFQDPSHIQAKVEKGEWEHETTSGTTTEPMNVIMEAGWWDQQEQEAFSLNAFISSCLAKGNGKRLVLVPPACSPGTCMRQFRHIHMRQQGSRLFLNHSSHPFLLPDWEWERMLSEWKMWKPQFIDASPTYLAAFCAYLRRTGQRAPKIDFVVLSYEFVSRIHRDLVMQTLGCPAFTLYGTTETGHLLLENEMGRMMPSEKTAILELLNHQNQPSEPYSIGRIVTTTLTQKLMPLVRYDTRDLAHFDSLNQCWTLHGRIRDLLWTQDTLPVTVEQIDQVISHVHGLVSFQLKQLETTRFELLLVPVTKEPSMAELRKVDYLLTTFFGENIQVKTRCVEGLSAESSGKFRLCKSAINGDLSRLP